MNLDDQLKLAQLRWPDAVINWEKVFTTDIAGTGNYSTPMTQSSLSG